MGKSKLTIHNILFACFFLLSFTSCKTQNSVSTHRYTHPIEFKPESYVCYKTDSPIVIDGKAEEIHWQKANWSNSFVDIEGNLKPLPTHNTQVKMLWDDTYFYFFAKMDEPNIWATLENRDDIIYNDDGIEIFIDPDGDSHNYYELEWNAYNTLWDLILLRPYRVDRDPKMLFEWNIKDVKSAVHIEGTINDNSDVDKYWTIEVAIPWFALREFAPTKTVPNDGDHWRVNFSRVDWTVDKEGQTYKKRLSGDGKKLPQSNWVWSPTGFVNMHMPEMWGFVQFSTNMPDNEVAFIENDDELIKWNLWNMYWQQLDYFKKNKTYSEDLNLFTIPSLEECIFNPKIYTTPNHFEITNLSCDGNKIWIIQRDGKIYSKKITTENSN